MLVSERELHVALNHERVDPVRDWEWAGLCGNTARNTGTETVLVAGLWNKNTN